MANVRRSRKGDSHTVTFNDGKLTQRYNQTLIVELDTNDPDPITGDQVRVLPGVPKPGLSTYSPRDGRVIPFCVCKSVTPTPDPNSRRLWYARCTFELEGSADDDQDDSGDPTSLDAKVEPFCDETEAIMLVDWDGKKILNPFDDLFDEPVMAPIPLPGVRVTRYLASYDENTLAYWKHTTNTAEWRNKPADAWTVRNVTGSMVQYGNNTIGQLVFDIVANPLEMELPNADGSAGVETRRYGWLEVRAARSFEHIVNIGGNAERVIHRLKKGGPPRMTWLDKDGNKSDDPNYQAFRNRRQRDFEIILPTPPPGS